MLVLIHVATERASTPSTTTSCRATWWYAPGAAFEPPDAVPTQAGLFQAFMESIRSAALGARAAPRDRHEHRSHPDEIGVIE